MTAPHSPAYRQDAFPPYRLYCPVCRTSWVDQELAAKGPGSTDQIYKRAVTRHETAIKPTPPG
jgi:hypothetical protein